MCLVQYYFVFGLRNFVWVEKEKKVIQAKESFNNMPTDYKGILDIDKYPTFIPYCINSKVYERYEKGDIIFIIADLTIGKGIFQDTYKSDVRYNKKNDIIK